MRAITEQLNFKHSELLRIIWLFSDEKLFEKDQKVNIKNDKWLCIDLIELLIMIPTKE